LIYEIFSCNGVVGSGGASKVYERGRRKRSYMVWTVYDKIYDFS
jgi:hypothetical protein